MIDFSFCRHDDIEQLIRFIGAQWKGDHIFVRNPDFLRWHYGHHKCLEVPDGGLSILLARDGDRIVGMLGLNEIGFYMDGRRGYCVWTSIWYADPEYRRQAIGMRLWKSALDLGADAICMVGMNSAVKSFFEHLEFEFLNDVPRFGAVFQPDDMARLVGQDSLSAGFLEFRPANTAPLDAKIEEFDDSQHTTWDAFLDDHMASGFAGAIKDSDYLCWRYVNHPIFKYQALTYAGKAGEPEALVVYRIEDVPEHDASVMRIVELIGSDVGQVSLLEHLQVTANQLDVVYCDVNAVNKKQQALITRSGMHQISLDSPVGRLIPHRFQPVDSPARPLISAFWLSTEFRQNSQRLTDHPGFYFSRADGDQDRPS